MILRYLYLTLVISFFVEITPAFSQLTEFSKDPEQFQDDIKKFFSGIKVEATDKVVADFLELLKTESYTPEEFLKIVNTCNLMLKKHLKPTPHFQDYFEILVIYKKNNVDIGKFRQWDEAYREQLAASKRNMNNFNEVILALFSKNALYSIQSKTWFILTKNYSIVYDKEPIIKVSGPFTLMCQTKEDSLIIYNTSGTYYPTDYKWIGSNGIVTWKRVELDSNEVYAKINYYKINVKQAEVVADSVVFWNKKYFSASLFGRLEEKALTTYQGKKASYPKFRSYKAVYILDKLSKNVLYIGGFTQEGLNMIGSSSMDIPGQPVVKARVIVSYKGKTTLKAASDAFLITPEKIIASNAQITIYYDQDSFYHPKMIFNYSNLSRKLLLTRGDVGMYRSPMYNTYHNLEMEFDQLDWDIDNPKMDIRMFQGSEGSAMFASSQLFTHDKYLKTQSVLTYNPLEKLKQLCVKLDTNVFHKNAFADYMGVRPEFIEQMLITLTMDGYIIYDNFTDMVLVRDKTFLYVNAEYNKMDYDMLQFESTIRKSNAVFSLESGNLNLEGVGMVLLSDTHRVHIVPQAQKIVVKKDLNFEFDGYIRGGLFEFFGNKFYFDYQNFKITMVNIDSLRFWVKTDPTQPDLIAKIQSVIQNVSGYLFIDKPTNKSGRINYSEYPIFECTKNSFVYYDKKSILGGVYDRDRFYFEIKPFTVDSLDKLTMTGLEFEGTFHSGGIVPVFDYKLVPQKDRSLGFTKIDSFPLYSNAGGSKGKSDIVLNLSNKGLRGIGEIEYLTSITKSDDFVFFLDSMRSASKSFDLAHNAMGKYPKVVGQDVFTRWFPYKDTMIIEKLKIPFKMYEKGYEYDGDLVLTPQRLTSKGSFEYLDATITSNLFEFTPIKLLSDDATVKIISDDPNLNAFIAPHIKLDLDVSTDILKGQSISSQHKILFPINRYITSMQQFVWYSLEKRIDLNRAPGQSEPACYFMSTKSGQDSLIFQSTLATYDLNKFFINAEKIPYISVADARVYPFDGKATIEKDAFMQSLVDAKVKADTINNYHLLYDAFINVFGKYKFTGYGKYDYIDKYKNKQVLTFYQIRVDDSRRTYARSKISDSMDFRISPQFKFSGYADLNGNIKELDFDGFVLAAHKVEEYRTGWFNYHNRINPDSVYFKLKIPLGKEGRELFTGVYNGSDSPYVYNLFLGYKKAFADAEIFSVKEGILYYNDITKKYIYGAEEKMVDNDLRGQYFSLEASTGNSYGEGRFDFGEDIKAIDLRTAGVYDYSGETGKYIFDAIISIDFPFDEKVLNQMSDKIIENSIFRKDLQYKRDPVMKGLAEIIDDQKERVNMLDEIENFNTVPISKSLQKTLVLTEVKLTYDLENRLFQTDKSTFGLINVKKTNINKYMSGAIQLSKKKSGTMFTIYIESDKSNYVFFKYYYGIFSVLSTDEELNKMLETTASKYSENKYRIKKGTTRELEQFKKKMNLY